jgi:hypothetical protein
VKTEYKTQCYVRHTEYALKVASQDDATLQDNFAKVFDLCAKEVEDDFRPACYSGLGHLATTEATLAGITDEAQASFARELCMAAQDYEALHYCVVAAARQFVYHYNNDAQAKELCEPLTSADLHAVCLQRTDEQMAKQQHRQESTL